MVHAKIAATTKSRTDCFLLLSFFFLDQLVVWWKMKNFFWDHIILDCSERSAFIDAAHLSPNALSPKIFGFLLFFLIDQSKTFIFLIFKNTGIWLDGFVFSWKFWQFVVNRLCLACFCAWLLLACMRAIARMFVCISLLIIEYNYLCWFGFLSYAFLFVC